MTSFYTRRGDDGTTGLLGEGRISKSDLRMDALGAVDEVMSALGLARALSELEATSSLLLKIQRDLYALMSEIAAAPEHAARFRSVSKEHVAWLEEQIDALSRVVEMPREFIIPGDTPGAAALDVARTSVRRAERRVVKWLQSAGEQQSQLLPYLNRLSSLCFALELREIQSEGSRSPTFAKARKK